MVHPPLAEEAASLTGSEPAPVRWAAWREWKRRCALGRCEAPARRILRSFAAVRFRKYCRSYAARSAYGDAAAWNVDTNHAWHLFETSLVTLRTREGKAYKSWLFARVPGGAPEEVALDAVQGGASLVLRATVRDWLARETPPAGTVALDRPLAVREGMTVMDTFAGSMPDPADDAAGRELEAMAADEARRLLGHLTARERIVAAAREIGWPLSHPALVALAGCRKSILSQVYRDMIDRVAGRLRLDFQAEDPSTLRVLIARTLVHLHRLAAEENSEMMSGRAFRGMGGRPAVRPAPRPYGSCE